MFAKSFVKLKPGGGKDPAPAQIFENDINISFASARENFIGHFDTEEYQIVRGYLDGWGVQLRLYYTRLIPHDKKIASLCIVHGLGEHLGRYMEVEIRNYR